MAKPIRATSPLVDAAALFQSGRFEEAHKASSRLALGRGREALDAHVLAAQSELRLGAFDAVIARLEPLAKKDGSSTLVLTLLGFAMFRSGRQSQGVGILENAYGASTLPVERAEAAYYRAWAAYSERQLESADNWIARALDDAEGALYARGLGLSGWIAASRTDYVGAARAFRLALGALRSSHEQDDDLAARMLHEIAVYAAELPDLGLAEFTGVQLAQFVWPSASEHGHFQTLLHFGIALESAGEVDRALDAFDEAESIASGEHPVWKAHVELERADLYRILGEPKAASRALRRATAMLRKEDWARSSIDAQMALLESCLVAARLDPAIASEWLTRYSALPKKDPGWHTLANDRRVQANELHARGIVEASVGNRQRGLRKLQESLTIWESLGYNRRAAYGLTDIAAFGDVTELVRASALRAKMAKHPLFGPASPNLAQPSPPPDVAQNIPPAERRVLDALCAGASVREIATKLERSEFTIRNTLKRLFARFEVRSSAALVAKALHPKPPDTTASEGATAKPKRRAGRPTVAQRGAPSP